MDRTAATYKLREGLSYYNHKEIVNKMIKYPFSINMDECTSDSNKRVFSILVSYYDELKGESVVEHYELIECKVVHAENLFQEIVSMFLRDNISRNDLVLDLSDSTDYMHGKKKWTGN